MHFAVAREERHPRIPGVERVDRVDDRGGAQTKKSALLVRCTPAAAVSVRGSPGAQDRDAHHGAEIDGRVASHFANVEVPRGISPGPRHIDLGPHRGVGVCPVESEHEPLRLLWRSCGASSDRARALPDGTTPPRTSIQFRDWPETDEGHLCGGWVVHDRADSAA